MHRCLHTPLLVASCPTTRHVVDIPTFFAVLTMGVVVLLELRLLGFTVRQCGELLTFHGITCSTACI